MSTRRREDCCLFFSQKLFNKDNINYKTSILYRQTLILRVRHFPRLLGKARPYYLIVPLLNHRFREMFRRASLAQHDRKQILRDEKQLLPLFSVGATIGRPLSVIKNKTFFSRLVIRTKHYAHHTRTVIPVRNVLTRCHSEHFILLSFRAKPRNLVETNAAAWL